MILALIQMGIIGIVYLVMFIHSNHEKRIKDRYAIVYHEWLKPQKLKRFSSRGDLYIPHFIYPDKPVIYFPFKCKQSRLEFVNTDNDQIYHLKLV